MKKVCLMFLLACGGLWCGHVRGYSPEVDGTTGLCTFRRMLQISELTDKEVSAGIIGMTDATGGTPISFSWRHPETKEYLAVCWTAKVWYDRYDPFFYDGHLYDVVISKDGSEIEIWVDGGIYTLIGKLAEIGGDSSVSAWQNARTIKGIAEGASGVLGIFEVKCGKAGKDGIAKVSASLAGLDGKRTNFKAQDVDVSGGTADVAWPLSNGAELRVTVAERDFGGSGGGMSVRSATIGGISNWDVLVFSVAPVSLDVPDGFKLLDVNGMFSWGGGEPVYVNRTTGRWKCRKAMLAKYVQYRAGMPMPTCCAVEPSESYLNVACDCAAENRIGLTLNYNPRQGLFKGSFKVYATREDGRKGFKKYTAKVTGVVVDGKGYGQATCKRPAGGPWAVTVQ